MPINALVSIIIPVFNREEFLTETINSVIGQTYPNWELLLVDDGSTDRSIQIAQEFANRDTRIKSIQRSRKPKGAPTCRNIGMKLAEGELIMFLDSDDSLEPFCLSQRVYYMLEHPTLDYSVWNINAHRSGDRVELWCDLGRDEDDLKNRLLLKSWQTSAPIYRLSSIANIKWDEYACSWQDWEFAIKLLLNSELKYKKLIESSPDVNVNRMHSDNISSNGRSYERIRCLFELIVKNERILVNAGMQEYLRYLKTPFFNFSEIASIEIRNKTEFQVLYKYFSDSLTFDLYRNKRLLKAYLKSQNSLSKFRYGQAILYRLMKFCLRRYAI